MGKVKWIRLKKVNMLWGFMPCDIYVIIAMNTRKVII